MHKRTHKDKQHIIKYSKDKQEQVVIRRLYLVLQNLALQKTIERLSFRAKKTPVSRSL